MEAFKPGEYICDECGDEEHARRLAQGMDVLTATRLVADVLGARPTWLEAVQQSKAAFLEASLMALEDGTFHGDPSACIAAYDAVLRAAEARTAWHPIETAPRGEWVEVWGTLFRCDEPGHHIARLDSWGWGDRAGIMIEPTHYRRLGPAHLPAAPEAP